MNYQIYKTPDFHNRLDASLPCQKNIADLLLNFDDTIHIKEGLRKIVTTPAKNEIGFNVVACQVFFRGLGPAAYVFLPDRESLYQFRPEETGILEKKFDTRSREERDEYETELKKLSVTSITVDDWYHCTGTPQNILAELQIRCTPLRR